MKKTKLIAKYKNKGEIINIIEDLIHRLNQIKIAEKEDNRECFYFCVLYYEDGINMPTTEVLGNLHKRDQLSLLNTLVKEMNKISKPNTQ
ncbi:MAG: hypothetical protein ACFFDH_00260 [Promethearchaeota archaeon]